MDILSDFKTVISDLMDLWPDILHEDALLIKEGGREAGQ